MSVDDLQILQSSVASSCSATSQPQRIIVFSRYPESGVTKTRLIPALGPENAAKLQSALTHHTLSIAGNYCAANACDLEVRFAGGNASLMEFAFGKNQCYRSQHGRDLGERLTDAVATALDEGATRVLVIGCDCPGIDPRTLEEAFNSLAIADVVFGPAVDGGYYLIGLCNRCPEVFHEIDWGTENVLQQSLQACRKLNLSVRQLAPLSDVDYPEDLIACRREPTAFANVLPVSRPGLLSIIVPTLNEAKTIESTLRSTESEGDVELIIADAGSTDDTTNIAKNYGAIVVPSRPGRGRQMNAGAAMASGDVLLFLHADSTLPIGYLDCIRSTLNQKVIAGAFRLNINDTHWGLRWIERGANLRSRYRQLPYGDQGIFVSAPTFYDLGGFSNWPLMEDYDLCRRLRKQGQIRLANASIKTSARRWLTVGLWRTTLVNQLCIAGFCLGIAPEKLARWRSSR